MTTLVINPGSTSTKIGIFKRQEALLLKTIQHQQEDLECFRLIIDQKEYRKITIIKTLFENNIKINDINAIIGIGGLLRPGIGGVYRVNKDMAEDLINAKYGEHAANLGALIGLDIADELNLTAYIADPITTDEMQHVAKLSGLPEIERIGRSHTLNQKYTAALAASELNKSYDEVNLVVAHLGGGISITAHSGGRMVDTNNARGEGPFCIDRTGGLNAFELAKLCYSGKYPKEDMLKKINGNGGVVAYLGTRDFRKVVERCKHGDEKAQDVFNALAYQVAKEIAAMRVALNGDLDAVVLTGGMANSAELVKEITKRINFLGKVLLYPGEHEMEALASYMDRVLFGEITPMEYLSQEAAYENS